jgi:hypothetical protein
VHRFFPRWFLIHESINHSLLSDVTSQCQRRSRSNQLHTIKIPYNQQPQLIGCQMLLDLYFRINLTTGCNRACPNSVCATYIAFSSLCFYDLMSWLSAECDFPNAAQFFESKSVPVVIKMHKCVTAYIEAFKYCTWSR